MKRQWRVLRRDGVKGLALHVFVRNSHWFLSSLELYADGTINCWGYVDRALFQEELDCGWVQHGACIDGKLNIRLAPVLRQSRSCSNREHRYFLGSVLRKACLERPKHR